MGGYRWSGSGAVSDWLAGRRGLFLIEGSEASFGEIRALNYGLRYLVQTAGRQVLWGETLGRWAICPDPTLWDSVLGPPLTRERGASAPLYILADKAFTAAARFRIIPGLSSYKGLLDSQLGMDFRTDTEYLEAAGTLADALRCYVRERRKAEYSVQERNRQPAWHDPRVQTAASRYVGLLYKRLRCVRKDNAHTEKANPSEEYVPILDNAFSGLNPELFFLLKPELFERKVFLLVRRDPRDQFTDLVRLSGSTFSFSVGSFIRQYRRAQEKTKVFLRRIQQEPRTFVRLLNFEDFVYNTGGTRSSLRQELDEFLSPLETNIPPNSREKWVEGPFKPDQSADNIGIYRNSVLSRAVKRIEKELPEFLVH